MNGTISVPKAAKLIGCDQRTIIEGIDNGTFKFGFKFKGKDEWIYKVAEKPLMDMIQGKENISDLQICIKELKEIILNFKLA